MCLTPTLSREGTLIRGGATARRRGQRFYLIQSCSVNMLGDTFSVHVEVRNESGEVQRSLWIVVYFTDKATLSKGEEGRKLEGVCVMKDKELKL